MNFHRHSGKLGNIIPRKQMLKLLSTGHLDEKVCDSKRMIPHVVPNLKLGYFALLRDESP